MTTVERAARAICVTFGYDPDKDDEVGLGEDGDVNWNMFEDHARAVLTAIREPSIAMISAVAVTMPTAHEQNRQLLAVKHDWQAMIDAALEEVRQPC